MPGLSFLFKKTFHPVRTDNQKRVYLAEQSLLDQKEKEAIAAKEVQKEKEIVEYEAMGSMQQRDPRSSSLKFMYSMPHIDEKKLKPGDVVGKHYEPKVDQNGEDEMVQQFRAKLLDHQGKANNTRTTEENLISNEEREFMEREREVERNMIKSKLKGAIMQPQSALEKALGRRIQIGVTNDEQVERHPFLKNAPVDGSYAKNMSAHHKPFNEIIRNVNCARCGKWGHRSGERECPLRDFNPLDSAMKQREDPMARYVNNNDNNNDGRAQFNSSSSSSGSGRPNGAAVRVSVPELGGEEDEGEESDPEAQFLATLSRREKMLLLRRLQTLEGGVPVPSVPVDSSSSSSSSNSSGSDSDSSSSSGDKHKKKQRLKDRKRDKKNKKPRKEKKEKKSNHHK